MPSVLFATLTEKLPEAHVVDAVASPPTVTVAPLWQVPEIVRDEFLETTVVALGFVMTTAGSGVGEGVGVGDGVGVASGTVGSISDADCFGAFPPFFPSQAVRESIKGISRTITNRKLTSK